MFRLLSSIKDLQQIVVYVNENQILVLTFSKTILFPVNVCLFKVNNRNTRKRRKICPKLKKTPKRRRIVNSRRFEHILLLVLLFPMLTLN